MNGDLVWLKNYNFPAFAGEIGVEVVKVGNNYAIYGTGTLSGKTAQLLLLLDHDGNVITAKQLTNTNEATVLPLSKGEAVEIDNHLAFVGTTGNLTNTDWSLLKTDANLAMNDECTNLQATESVTVALVTGPLNYNATIRTFVSTTATENVAAPLVTTAVLESQLLCPACPNNPGIGDNAGDRSRQWNDQSPSIYPNPTNGRLLFDLATWENQTVQVQILNAQGQLVQTMKTVAVSGLQSLELSSKLPNGLYQLVVRPKEGAPVSKPFVLER